MDADQLVRVLGLSRPLPGESALARKALALTMTMDVGVSGGRDWTPAREMDESDSGSPGRGLVIGVGLSAVLWMVLAGGTCAMMR